ncbi:MAG: hypothetical protein HY842_17625 [Bacteroidetes bacterium]|nr:hypothetical protein [Bacteroidota bacterium]
MKYLFFFLAFSMLCFACKDEPKTATTATDDGNPKPPADLSLSENGITQTVQVVDTVTGKVYKTERPIAAISTAIGANPIVKEDPVKPVPLPPLPKTPQETRVARVLMSNYWVVQGLVRIKDKQASFDNPGAWFKFNADGSYDYGYLEKKIGSGAWTIDGLKATVHLDAPLVGDDREWRMQIAKTEDVMVWVGTDRYHTASINMKLINLLFIPKNRKEMGLDW